MRVFRTSVARAIAAILLIAGGVGLSLLTWSSRVPIPDDARREGSSGEAAADPGVADEVRVTTRTPARPVADPTLPLGACERLSGMVTGTVRDANTGVPVANAVVTIRHDGTIKDDDFESPGFKTFSDDHGRFELVVDLHSATGATLSCASRGFRVHRSRLPVLGAAAPHHHRDIQLERASLGIEVVGVGLDQKPRELTLLQWVLKENVVGPRDVIVERDMIPAERRLWDPDSRPIYDAGHPPSPYSELRISAHGFAATDVPRRQLRDSGEARVRLVEGHTIAGVVAGIPDRPCEVRVSVRKQRRADVAVFAVRYGVMTRAQYLPGVEVAPDRATGRFVVSNLDAGDYLITARCDLADGSSSLVSPAVKVAVESKVEEVAIQLAESGAVEIARLAHPTDDAVVVLHGPHDDWVAVRASRESGPIRVHDVRPGAYAMSIGSTRYPESGYISRSVDVAGELSAAVAQYSMTVDAGETLHVQIAGEGYAPVRGVIAGEARMASRVLLFDRTTGRTLTEIDVDEDGEFSSMPVACGAYGLVVEGADGTPIHAQWIAADERSPRREIAVSSGGIRVTGLQSPRRAKLHLRHETLPFVDFLARLDADGMVPSLPVGQFAARLRHGSTWIDLGSLQVDAGAVTPVDVPIERP